MDRYPNNRLVHINFVDINHRIYMEDSITIDTRIGVKSNYDLSKIPDYACGIYLTWTDPNLYGKLPDFVGRGGQIFDGKALKEMMKNEDEYVLFCNDDNGLCVKIEEVLDDNNEDDYFLVYNHCVTNDKGKSITGKLVVWHLRDLDFVLKDDINLIEYINYLPVKVKYLKDKNILPIQ